jgi:hypothetical protein
MSVRVDTLITKYVLDDQYTRKAAAVSKATDGITASMAQNAAAKAGITKIPSMGDQARNLSIAKAKMVSIGTGAIGAMAAIFGAGVVALVAGGAMLFRAAAKHDAGIQASLERTQMSIDKAVTIAGVAFSKKLLPLVEDFAAALDALSEDGTIKRTFDSIADSLARIFGLDANAEATEIFYDAAEKIMTAAEKFAEAAAMLAKADKISNWQRWLVELVGVKLGWISSGGGETKTDSRAVRFQKRLDADVKAGATAGTMAGSAELRVLDKIERHTREMVNIQRMVLGGGELGRNGVTAVDVGVMRNGRRSRGGGGRIEAAVMGLVDAIQGASWDAIEQSGRGMARS